MDPLAGEEIDLLEEYLRRTAGAPRKDGVVKMTLDRAAGAVVHEYHDGRKLRVSARGILTHVIKHRP